MQMHMPYAYNCIDSTRIGFCFIQMFIMNNIIIIIINGYQSTYWNSYGNMGIPMVGIPMFNRL